MSVIVADTFKTRVAGAAVTTENGLNVGGATTVAGAVVATSFAGDGSSITALSGSNISSGTVAAARVATLNQDTTGTAALAEGLTGTPDITVRNITGVAATFTGVLTYEDVTNVDSVGIVTARSGIKFGAAGVGGTITGAGAVNIIGISTFESNVEFGQAGVGGTVTALGHAEFVGIVTASGLDAAISVWTLGASGTSHYTFTGPGALSGDTDPTLQLVRGQKYIFKNRSGGHPFRIQSTVNGSAGTAYNDGVTNNDAADGTDLVFDVPYDAPSVLYYQCTSHAAMGGVLYIGSSSGYGLKVAGTMVEGMSSTTTAYNTSGDLNITNGNFHFNSANLGGTGTTLNIMSTTGINTTVNVNEVLNVTAVTAVNASTAFVNKVTIDGKATGITTHWVGGEVPSDGGGSGVDTYSFNILKTGSETYIIIANQVKTSS
jgi:hypothetical protein